MGYLGNQNILRLPKITDCIKVKEPILGKSCGDCIKKQQQRKPSYEPML